MLELWLNIITVTTVPVGGEIVQAVSDMLTVISLTISTAEDEKNRHALQLVLKIMANATWINIHCLPVRL